MRTPTLLYYGGQIEKCQIREEWGRWISGLADWSWFFTGTFRDPSDEEIKRGYTQRGWKYADKAWDSFVGSLCQCLKTDSWVRVFEFQKFRGNGMGVPHIHALVAGVDELWRKDAWSWWFDRYGFARIVRYDERRGAGYYLSEYVSKDLSSIRFSEDLFCKVIEGRRKMGQETMGERVV